jgi:hypothetical protein
MAVREGKMHSEGQGALDACMAVRRGKAHSEGQGDLIFI